ncbi:uncharacterized protein [Montipora capricornis]|uniref:uncharacterized protein n=1 Tax=Montipora capricornis TaxID=246305 RepID=UPI0035F16838
MGGVWERQIRTVRRILSTLLREHGNRLDDESLHTLLREVESIVNSRPITAISSDFRDPLPLSPSQILTMKTKVVLPPPGKYQRNDVYMAQGPTSLQLVLVSMEKRISGCTPAMTKVVSRERNMKIHDVVLIKDENTPRNDWSMGVIVNVELDSKGLVRSVVVRTETTEL